MDVARKIIEKLGGYQFIAMTGAKSFLSLPLPLPLPGVVFRFPGALTKTGCNMCKIELQADGLYQDTFSRLRALKNVEISCLDGIGPDQLRKVFETETGLLTHL